jgi:hypothetical protein
MDTAARHPCLIALKSGIGYTILEAWLCLEIPKARHND